MTNQLNHLIAQQHINDLHVEAARARLARQARPSGGRAQRGFRMPKPAKRMITLRALQQHQRHAGDPTIRRVPDIDTGNHISTQRQQI